MDVVRKLVSFREAGYKVTSRRGEASFRADEYFEGSLEDFWSGCLNSMPTLRSAAATQRKNAGVSWQQ